MVRVSLRVSLDTPTDRVPACIRVLTRRRLLSLASTAIVTPRQRPRGGDSRLRVRVGAPSKEIGPGQHPLGLGSGRDGLLCVPASYRAASAAPLAVLLHGAGGSARRIVSLLGIADTLGVVVLAPESRGSTWDVIRGDFGPDVEFVNRALEYTFDRCAIDQRHLAIGGFSDGASYALSLGLDNGTLFTHILAFSPGFSVNRTPIGRPRVFISHGTNDRILSIDRTSRALRPKLEEANYSLTYREFDGPHTVPAEIAEEAFRWFAKR
jgi:phospholipase/carboxylesterase